ncbi:hypothetical protein AVEN_63144-1 [Araneus ventricosus]|uniref:Uncharacterized protein n=1 Tax=Araneus ventricosus TaxID=182803 RepID=A0A4Y2B0D3_ARAVE|nr:hypothetical protein AVEN_63144-1 [Araneus ventricosus]
MWSDEEDYTPAGIPFSKLPHYSKGKPRYLAWSYVNDIPLVARWKFGEGMPAQMSSSASGSEVQVPKPRLHEPAAVSSRARCMLNLSEMMASHTGVMEFGEGIAQVSSSSSDHD